MPNIALCNHDSNQMVAGVGRPPSFRRETSSLYSFGKASDFLEQKETCFVTYITDVEGDKAYLDRYVKASKVLAFEDNDSSNSTEFNTQDESTFYQRLPYASRITFSEPSAILVYGGDVWDKGGFDLYVIRQLLDLKRRYPSRVYFVLGNRDLNKLRILQEMGLPKKSFPLPEHPGLSWFHGTGRIGDPVGPAVPEDEVLRLQWILANTMGSPDAFLHRKNELQWERDQGHCQESADNKKCQLVSDIDVVDSYRKSCHPSGELGQFLAQGHLAFRLGPLLFVHGCLPLGKDLDARPTQTGYWDEFTQYMPWLPSNETAGDHGVTCIDSWTDALNGFCSQKVAEWRNEIALMEDGQLYDKRIWAHRGGYHYGPSYSALIQYGMGLMPDRKTNPTVVYNSFTPSGMPQRFMRETDSPQFLEATTEFMEKSTIKVILAGHKPQGDTPSPIRIGNTGWVVCADTSYSGDTNWYEGNDENDLLTRTNLGRGDAPSFRGEVAVSEVLIQFNKTDLHSVHCHGTLSDGKDYETVNFLDHQENSTIGQVAPVELVPGPEESPHQGLWWTKSIFSDGSHLFHAAEGFHVWNLVRPADSPEDKCDERSFDKS